MEDNKLNNIIEQYEIPVKQVSTIEASNGIVDDNKLLDIIQKYPKKDDVSKTDLRNQNQNKQNNQQQKQENKESNVLLDLKFKNPYLKDIKIEKDAASKDNFQKIEDVYDFAAKQGFEIKDTKDFKQVFDTLEEFQKENENLKQDSQTKTYYENLINSLPPELGSAMYEYAMNGGDGWKEKIKPVISGNLDFSKDFDAYTPEKIITHYFPDYSKEDMEDMDEKAKTVIKESARKLYLSDRKTANTYKDNYSKSMQESVSNLSNSIKSSINNLKASNPKLTKKELNTIEDMMKNGINKSILDDKGYYKKEAAMMISDMLYARQAIEEQRKAIEELVKRGVRKGSTQTAEELLLRNSGKVEKRGDNQLEDERKLSVQKQTSFLKDSSPFKLKPIN
jgi:hypothetical protein